MNSSTRREKTSRLIIIGARAFGREVFNYAREAGFEVVGFLDDRADALDGFVGYPPILGSAEDWEVRPEDRFVCAVGDSRQRAKYAAMIEGKGGAFVSVVHPTAYVGPNVKMGAGCIVAPQAMVDCDLTIGCHVVVNVHAFVAHDCVLEDCVTLSPNVHLGGRTVIRGGAFLGIGASTIPDVEIKGSAIVAAGACVIRDVPAGVMVAGVPATVRRQVSLDAPCLPPPHTRTHQYFDVSGKTLLILAGAEVHLKIVETAHRLGIRTVVADYLPREKSPCKRMAGEALDVDIFAVDELVDYCRKHNVDGVIDFCIDPAQRPAQQVAERVGLPVFGGWDQVVALTDKSVFKRACAAAGVDVIPSYSEEDVRQGAVEYPVVVKPVDSRGSRGISRCANAEEVFAAIETARRHSSTGSCLIEKCMLPDSSQDLTISYLVKDGEPILVSLGDRHSGRTEDGLDRQLICTIQPSRYVAEYLLDADIRIRRLIRQIGIRNGPVFFQGFYDHGKVRLYDPGLRFPGNEYERILRSATGVDLMECLIRYCVTGKIGEPCGRLEGCYELAGMTCLQYMINAGPGRIAVYDGLAEIAEHPNVVDVKQKHFVGDVILPTGDIGHRIGEISVLCERTPAKMKEMIDFIHANLSVRDERGRNLLISEFSGDTVDRWYGSYGGKR